VLHRAAEELKECLSSQNDVLQRCSKLQHKLEQETRALAAILPLAFKEVPKLEWSEECYLDDAVQRLGHLASPSLLLPDTPIIKTPELTYPDF
jgi:ubiquinone biosynthesis protein COQ9